MMQLNSPSLWRAALPVKSEKSHKYSHGHALIYAAPELTGASRLAAESCARVGAGLVTLLAPGSVVASYRASLPAHIIARDDLDWDDARVSAKLYGSGGLCRQPDFQSQLPVVLDADALAVLPEKLSPNYVLTPHEGEFARAFPDLTAGREARALAAAQRSGAVVVLKGAQTLIAAPDGRIVINRHAAAHLATAGSGDVLAGMITGLLAQGMPCFEAATAAVWMHGDCALRFGTGLVASDLPGLIPQVLQALAPPTSDVLHDGGLETKPWADIS